MTELLPAVGSWFWFIMAALLLFGELLMPGIFLLWLGVAAVLTGVIDYFVGFGWQGEIATFAGLSLAVVLATWRMVSQQWQPKSDQPHLNRRLQGFVGQSFVLDQAIVNGRGKLRIQDALWDVAGPDLPAGTRVSVMEVDGMQLKVTAL